MKDTNQTISHNQMVSLIWNIADDVLRDVFLRGQYRDVILPMIVLRRLDALLEPTKAEVDAEVKENGIDPDVLMDITRLPYYNASKWTLNRLKSQAGDDERILLDNYGKRSGFNQSCWTFLNPPAPRTFSQNGCRIVHAFPSA